MKRFLSILLMFMIMVNTGIVAYGGVTKGVFIASTPKTITASATDTIEEAEGTRTEISTASLSLCKHVGYTTKYITKVRVYSSPTTYKDYTSYENMTVYPGQKVVLYHDSSRWWSYTRPATQALGKGEACRFTVPSSASGNLILDIGEYSLDESFCSQVDGRVDSDGIELGDRDLWLWNNNHAQVPLELGE